MPVAISAAEALWFLPFATPVCLWVVWSDLRVMRIPNMAVLTLAGLFIVVGLIALPLAEFPWRLAQFGIVLVLGFVANAGGLMGAGDSKFLAAAAPFVAPGDVTFVLLILAATLLAAYATHRMIKHSPLRRLAPQWESWHQDKKFPMGFALGSTLVIYLGLGVAFGQ